MRRFGACALNNPAERRLLRTTSREKPSNQRTRMLREDAVPWLTEWAQASQNIGLGASMAASTDAGSTFTDVMRL